VNKAIHNVYNYYEYYVDSKTISFSEQLF